MSDSPEPVPAPGVAVGAQLAAARVARNLAVADVARQLKLSPWQVEALEADNYERLPGAVFVRGFIRNYARFVEMDPAPLLAAVEPGLPRRDLPKPELSPSANIPFKTGREIPWSRYVIVVAVLLAPLVIFELFFHDENSVTTTASTHPAAVPPSPMVGIAPGASGDTAPTNTNSEDAAKTESGDGDNAAKADSSDDSEKAPEAPLPVVHVTAVGGQHHLSFQFNQESWTEVRDGHGQRIFSQLNAAGTQQTVIGVPPLRLVVGNASGVRLQVNDKTIDMTPYTAVDVARFALE